MLFLIAILINTQLLAQSTTLESVVINNIPANIDDFITLRDKIAITPQGGAALFIIALKIYQSDKTLGSQCLVIGTDKALLRENANGYKGFSLLNTDIDLINKQLSKQTYLLNSYIKGANPTNNYQVTLPYTFEFSTNPYSGDIESGLLKLYIKCSGADSDRPFTVRKNDKGIWKATNWSSILVGIKKTAAEKTDDL